jgi:hypothetical protein
MLMQAIRPWFNPDHEGQIEPGDQFECGPLRAQELEAQGLALPAVSDTAQIVVRADNPFVETADGRAGEVQVATRPKARRLAR